MSIVLVVEDDLDTADALSTALTARGYITTVAPNGREALRALTTRPPDLIILDLLMPVMDGMAFLDVLRSYLRWSALPVIVVTAVSDPVELEALNRFNVSQVFLKASYNLADLLNAVAKLLPP
jgi:CheY-like chemotaxis protein